MTSTSLNISGERQTRRAREQVTLPFKQHVQHDIVAQTFGEMEAPTLLLWRRVHKSLDGTVRVACSSVDGTTQVTATPPPVCNHTYPGACFPRSLA